MIVQQKAKAVVIMHYWRSVWLNHLSGCQSLNHSECYGDLWQCAQCGKTVCYAEGTDDDLDLCDDCWVQTHDPVWWREVERRRAMDTAVKMQAVITQVLEQHGIDVRESDLFLWLILPEHRERLIIERIDERYLSVALARAEQLGYFTMAPQLFFSTDTTGWTPIHLDGAEATDDLMQFAEAWAQQMLDEGWLEHGEQRPDPPWVVNQEALWASMYDDADEVDDPATESEEEESCDDIPF
jgi:hypothetical protein